MKKHSLQLKEKKRIYSRLWRLKNKEKQRKYYEDNKEKLKNYSRGWRLNNKKKKKNIMKLGGGRTKKK